MISVWMAVLKDLWDFVCGRDTEDQTPIVVPQFSTSSKRSPINSGPLVGLRTAFICVYKTDCYTTPRPSFDGLVGSYYYGHAVQVRRIEGAMAEVHTGTVVGWVPTHHIDDNVDEIFPRLQSVEIYTATHQSVRRLRMYINDTSLGDYLDLPLQPLEYILYTLKQRKREIAWPPERPRRIGTLHELLRYQTGVVIGKNPKTGALLEVSDTKNQPAFVAVVEAVMPDESIRISSVGRISIGEYRVEVLTKSEWFVWQPNFIQVT